MAAFGMKCLVVLSLCIVSLTQVFFCSALLSTPTQYNFSLDLNLKSVSVSTGISNSPPIYLSDSVLLPNFVSIPNPFSWLLATNFSFYTMLSNSPSLLFSSISTTYGSSPLTTWISSANLNASLGPSSTNITFAPDTLQLAAAVNATSTQIFAVGFWDDQPFFSYASSDLICTRIAPLLADEPFACRDISLLSTSVNASYPLLLLYNNTSDALSAFSGVSGHGYAIFNTTYIGGQPGSPASVSLQIITNYDFASGDAGKLSQLFSIALQRLADFSVGFEVSKSIADSNTTRRNSSRVAVGFLWFFVSLTMFLLLLNSAVWQTWLWPAPLKYVPVGSTSHDRLFILVGVGLALLLCFITALATATGGLAAFVGIAVLLLLYVAGVNITYCCIRARHRDAVEVDGEESKNLMAIRVNGEDIDGRTDEDDDKDGGTATGTDGTDAAIAPLPEPRKELEYSRIPLRLGRRQRELFAIFAVLFLLSVTICVAIFGIWSVDDYFVFYRQQPQAAQVEFQPQTIAKSVEAVYSFDGLATGLKMNNAIFSVSTEWCGTHYSQFVSPSDRQQVIYLDFIQEYAVDMSIYSPSDYEDYPTVNSWFVRQLANNTRPVAFANNSDAIVSCCDSRVTVFEALPNDAVVWIKTSDITAIDLLGGSNRIKQHYTSYADGLNFGSFVLHRLAPQDYHRFHVPLEGVIKTIYQIEGTLQSVNADGMRSKNYAYYNQRTVVIITNPIIGDYAFIAIGALCVGSVSIGPAAGTNLTKGQELGFFEFGGSTVALLFPPNTVRFDNDLVTHTQNAVESLTYKGTRLGAIIRK